MSDKPKDQEKPGVAARAAEHLADRLNPKTVLKEAMDGVTDKIIPQGAAELAQALYTGNGYVPYGHAQEPVEPLPEQQGAALPEHGVHGKQEEDKQQETPQEPKQPGWAQRFAEVREQLKAGSKDKEISM